MLDTQRAEGATGVSAGLTHGGRVGLPLPLTRLVGREQEVRATREAVLSPDARLVTLTGPGGVGKSRVAIQVAWELQESFVDGVRLIRLATMTEPDLLYATIALAVDLPDPGGLHPIDTLHAGLAGKQMLLLLDSFDPIMVAAPLVAELLRACPDLRALVTSRERLRLRGEHVLRIPPLPTPAAAELADPAALARNPAVALLVQQAREVLPDFRPDADNAASLAGIVKRLDGLPLAIELAAARLTMFPPNALLQRLERRLPVLQGGAADLPDRLRTMHSAVAWSYDLLRPGERALFRDLSVFAGGFPLDAVAAVCGLPDAMDALEGVASLVDKSLLYQEPPSGEDPRYAMLDIIREFGLEHLDQSQEGEAVRRRHALWCLRLAEQAARQRQQEGGSSIWLDRLDHDIDDLWAALGWLETAADPETFLRLAAALGWFYFYRSHRSAGRRWLTRAIAQGRDAGVRTEAMARALDGASVLAYTQGDYEEAGTLATEYLALSQELDDTWGTAAALNLLGVIARAEADYDRANEAFTQALTLFQQQALLDWTALAMLNLGTVAYWQGTLDRATTLIGEALVLFREQGDPYGTAVALSDLALAAWHRNDPARAAALFRESLDAWRRVGTKEVAIDWLARVATLAAAIGHAPAATQAFGAVEQAREAIGYSFEPPERARQERAREALRTELGAAPFDAALLAGRQLPFDEAVNRADALLRRLGEPLPGPAAEEAPAPFGLTPRELDVLRLLVDGRSDRQIGDALSISHRTVMRHVEHILAKLDCDSRTAAATQAVRLGIV